MTNDAQPSHPYMIVPIPSRPGLRFKVDESDWYGRFEFRLNDGSVTFIEPHRHTWGLGGTRPWEYVKITPERHGIKFTAMLHRLLLGYPAGLVVDHINGDRLDNRRKNLRACTNAENIRNMAVKSGRGRSKFKGVYFDKAAQRWRAQIGHQGKRYFIGHFATEREAAIAFNLKAIQLHGEFASLNEVPA